MPDKGIKHNYHLDPKYGRLNDKKVIYLSVQRNILDLLKDH